MEKLYPNQIVNKKEWRHVYKQENYYYMEYFVYHFIYHSGHIYAHVV